MKILKNIFVICITSLFFNSCSKDSAESANMATAGAGVGGSLAKFTIVGNYLYAVDDHNLYTYNISNPVNPVKTNTSTYLFDVETIYPFNNRLFIGSKTGLYIYSIDTPSVPSKLAEAKHGRSCDPVVANDTIAFVTLKGNSFCGPATSGLYVYKITNILQPTLIKTITINSPEGLGLKDSVLYVCCNNDGLKVFNVRNPANPVSITTVVGENFRDAIAYNNLLVCFVTNGLSLYSISNPLNPVLLKRINN